MSIKIEHVSHLYGEGEAFEKKALDDVTLEIPDGQFLGVIGHTGSGKSTLIQHLNGLLKATSGTIYYNNEDIYQENYDMKKLRSKVGLVFQYPEHQLFEVSVIKDVEFGPRNLGLSNLEVEKRSFDALKHVGLSDDLLDVAPFALSGGQKRRVAICRALCALSELLILDEPFTGLDAGTKADVIRYLQKKSAGKLTLLSTHQEEDILALDGIQITI